MANEYPLGIILHNPTTNLGFDMSFDSSMLHILTSDFNDKLIGGTIRHIQQVDAHTVIIKISGRTSTQFLFLSAHSTNARVHFTNQPPKGQKQRCGKDYRPYRQCFFGRSSSLLSRGYGCAPKQAY